MRTKSLRVVTGMARNYARVWGVEPSAIVFKGDDLAPPAADFVAQ